jgi:hypothetical protein
MSSRLRASLRHDTRAYTAADQPLLHENPAPMTWTDSDGSEV